MDRLPFVTCDILGLKKRRGCENVKGDLLEFCRQRQIRCIPSTSQKQSILSVGVDHSANFLLFRNESPR